MEGREAHEKEKVLVAACKSCSSLCPRYYNSFISPQDTHAFPLSNDDIYFLTLLIQPGMRFL